MGCSRHDAVLEVRQQELEAALTSALPAYGGVVRSQPLLKGHGHQSFVLETNAKDRLLLKIGLRSDAASTAKARRLQAVLALLAERGIPTPRLLHFCEGSASFGGRPWLIQEFWEGQDGEDALRIMSESQRVDYFRDFGRAVARLHAIEPELASWGDAVAVRLERLGADLLRANLLASSTVAVRLEAMRSLARAVSPNVRPGLAHRDLYLPNTLTRDGRFHCLIDFEHARAADPIHDFVKLELWVFAEAPGSRASFYEGYGGNPLASEEGRARYRLCLGLELLSGLLYWDKTGNAAMLADYRQRLIDWQPNR